MVISFSKARDSQEMNTWPALCKFSFRRWRCLCTPKTLPRIEPYLVDSQHVLLAHGTEGDNCLWQSEYKALRALVFATPRCLYWSWCIYAVGHIPARVVPVRRPSFRRGRRYYRSELRKSFRSVVRIIRSYRHGQNVRQVRQSAIAFRGGLPSLAHRLYHLWERSGTGTKSN
jgi:hypothetical protein